VHTLQPAAGLRSSGVTHGIGSVTDIPERCSAVDSVEDVRYKYWQGRRQKFLFPGGRKILGVWVAAGLPPAHHHPDKVTGFGRLLQDPQGPGPCAPVLPFLFNFR